MTIDQLQKTLTQLGCRSFEIVELERGSFAVTIVSPLFRDLPHMRRQQTLWRALRETLSAGDLSEVKSLRTLTPLESIKEESGRNM